MEQKKFFRRRFKIRNAHLPNEIKSADLLKALMQRVRGANDLFFKKPDNKKGRIRFNHLLPLRIEYGNGTKILATGHLKPEIAKELVEAGFLKRSGKLLELNISNVEEGKIPSREQVNTHFRKIENWALDKGYIPGLREPLYLADSIDESRKDDYACYDRNLDMLGLYVHSVAVILELTDGPYKGCVVVARRHNDFIKKNNDSIFDLASGAITSRYTRQETHASELLDEFNIEGPMLARIHPIDGKELDTITTARYRGEEGLVREKMRVSVLGITHDEFEKLSCNDAKLIDGKRHITNIGYYAVSPHEMAYLLTTKKYLRNAKALAMLLYLYKKGHLAKLLPSTRVLAPNLSMRPTYRFSIARGDWVKARRSTIRRRSVQSIFAPI